MPVVPAKSEYSRSRPTGPLTHVLCSVRTISINGSGRSLLDESDGEIRHMSSSGADHKRDNDLRSNLCDYSDEEDERLDIDDESSTGAISESNCGRKLHAIGSADKVEGNETLSKVQCARGNLISPATNARTVHVSIRRSSRRNNKFQLEQGNNRDGHSGSGRRALPWRLKPSQRMNAGSSFE